MSRDLLRQAIKEVREELATVCRLLLLWCSLYLSVLVIPTFELVIWIRVPVRAPPVAYAGGHVPEAEGHGERAGRLAKKVRAWIHVL